MNGMRKGRSFADMYLEALVRGLSREQMVSNVKRNIEWLEKHGEEREYYVALRFLKWLEKEKKNS